LAATIRIIVRSQETASLVLSNGSVAVFAYPLNTNDAMKALTIQLSRGARQSAAPEVINLVRRAAARLFSEKACAVILAVLTLSAVAIDIAVADTLRAQRLVGLCALAAMPWIGAILARFSRDTESAEKGGRK
jgi:hypothetical protein